MAPKRSSGSKVEKRRGRPSGSRNSITSKKQVSKPAPPKAKATRKRTFKTQHEGESSRPAKARKEPAGNRKNQPNRDDARDKPDEISAIQPQSQPQPQTQKCEQLATRTRRIAQDRIDTWPQVSPQVLNQIVEMLEDAKKDIVNTQRDHRRELLADETLNVLVGKLARQLSSSKIPPQAKDMHFNIDKLTERNAQLSREVTTERHSKQLLEEQVKVAQHMLESEQENLEQLKKNAKKWQGEWKRQERQGRLHPLLNDLEGNDDTEGDGPDDIGVKLGKADNSSLVDLDSSDPELGPLLGQLRRSLENMQGNHEQVAGIDLAMGKAQAALDDVLFRHASAPQYATL